MKQAINVIFLKRCQFHMVDAKRSSAAGHKILTNSCFNRIERETSA